MKDKDYIIGIIGDNPFDMITVASIINYIFNKGITMSTYKEWLDNEYSNNVNAEKVTIDFNTIIKNNISNLFNIHIDKLNTDDDLFYDFMINIFIKDVPYKHKSNIITLETLESYNIKDVIDIVNDNSNWRYIKLETLIEYFRNVYSNIIGYSFICKNTIDMATNLSYHNKVSFVKNISKPEEFYYMNNTTGYSVDVCKHIICINNNNDITPYTYIINNNPNAVIINYDNNNKIKLFFSLISYIQNL